MSRAFSGLPLTRHEAGRRWLLGWLRSVTSLYEFPKDEDTGDTYCDCDEVSEYIGAVTTKITGLPVHQVEGTALFEEGGRWVRGTHYWLDVDGVVFDPKGVFFEYRNHRETGRRLLKDTAFVSESDPLFVEAKALWEEE